MGLTAVIDYDAGNIKSVEKALALCPEDRRGDEFPPFPFRLLADQPFLVVREGQQIHDLYRTLVAETGVLPKIVLESESLTAALALAGAGLGATIVTETLARRSAAAKRVRFFSIDPEVPVRKVVAAYRPAPDHAGRGAGDVLPRVRRKAFPRARALPGAKRAPENPDARIA